MSKFNFLQNKFPDLYKQCVQAEEAEDEDVIFLKCRQALEMMVKLLGGTNGNLFKDINELAKEGILDDTLSEKFHLLRKMANHSIHKDGANVNHSTKDCLNLLFELTVWFAEKNGIDTTGFSYVNGRVQADRQKATEYLQRAEKSVLNAEKIKYYEMAAELGNAKAQFEAGIKYFYGEVGKGRGKGIDKKRAIKWIKRASLQEYLPAQKFLANCYAKGDGVPQDDKKAFELYLHLAEQNTKVALKVPSYPKHGMYMSSIYDYNISPALIWKEVGDSYYHGIGTVKNKEEAEKWYQKVEEWNHAVCFAGEIPTSTKTKLIIKTPLSKSGIQFNFASVSEAKKIKPPSVAVIIAKAVGTTLIKSLFHK